MSESIQIETTLRNRIDSGHKILVAYITGGLGNDWIQTLHSVINAGADVVEIGIPFSDPVMDGPVIQKANDASLRSGSTPVSILNDVRGESVSAPLAVMTYYNLVYRMGHERFASDLASAGISGCILPDLPLEELNVWSEAADQSNIETILLAAPTTPDDRLAEICTSSAGFVYAVGLLGVTGVRSELADSAIQIASRLKKHTSKPVLVGVGIGTPEQAVEASKVSDGVIVGSALVNEMLKGASPEEVGEMVASFRVALDKNS
ncbi:MAG: tryptophan synthase subunit alpha [Actinobacteria bacterium]|nr:tryptophan synthase subunit alpha [Actinomycetota bacterium]|tara:strand:+ start:2424 stop:3212 length:789 start_codon:yes stop_codon:yes gene_type:complete